LYATIVTREQHHNVRFQSNFVVKHIPATQKENLSYLWQVLQYCTFWRYPWHRALVVPRFQGLAPVRASNIKNFLCTEHHGKGGTLGYPSRCRPTRSIAAVLCTYGKAAVSVFLERPIVVVLHNTGQSPSTVRRHSCRACDLRLVETEWAIVCEVNDTTTIVPGARPGKRHTQLDLKPSQTHNLF